MRTRLLMIVVGVVMFAAATPRAAEAAAGSQSLTLKPSDGTSTTSRIELVLGDSIAAGYCGLFCRLDSYAVYYGRSIANGLDAQVDYRGHAQSGEVMSQISSRTTSNVASVKVADYITLEGCGNDFLDARSDYRDQSNCTDESVLQTALDNCRTYMVKTLDTIAANKKAGGKVRVMSLYYPGLATDRGKTCNGTSHFDIFLDYLLEADWTMCNEAWKRGFECVDGLATMNAADVDTNLDTDTLVDAAQVKINKATDRDNFDAYYNRVHAVRQILTDAHQKRTTATTTVDFLQSDDTHPTAAGHTRLGAEHLAVGL